jgi:hypothetical protein
MTADQAPVANAGCFLCGRPGATQLTSASSGVLRFECPACGAYDIRAIVHDGIPQPQQVTGEPEPGKSPKPVEMEAAAIELWTKSLEMAERERRAPKRTQEAPARPTNSAAASACA